MPFVAPARGSLGWRTAALLTLAAVLLVQAPLAIRAAGTGSPSFILATTTSTHDSGLLDELVPLFEKEHGLAVKVIAVGTGAALRMARHGDADAVLTHAPTAERELVQAGHLIEGVRIMVNHFVIVGPPEDPAALRGLPDLPSQMRALAKGGGFISRGDDSGTHKRELRLWEAAGVDPDTVPGRAETGQGMGATLHVADQRDAYTLSDRGTYLALSHMLRSVAYTDDTPDLLNPYSAYVVNPERHPGVRAAAARAWTAFLRRPAIQERIGRFRKKELGTALFRPVHQPGAAHDAPAAAPAG